MLGKGRAEAITDSDIEALAIEMGVHPADLEAIAEVESNGFGWFPDGRIKILFEKHWFFKHLSGKARENASKSGLARKNWISPKKAGYKDQDTADDRYRLLERAMRIDEEAALRSISMGKYQIMGFNYALCGFVSAKHMWEKFLDSEVHQLRAFATFLRKKKLIPALKVRDFNRIEEVYNGGGLNGAYAVKMRRASDELRSGKWKEWTPDKPVQPRKPVPIPSPAPRPEPAPAPVPDGKKGVLVLILAGLVAVGAWMASRGCEWFGVWCG